jgi:hypothetical protein
VGDAGRGAARGACHCPTRSSWRPSATSRARPAPYQAVPGRAEWTGRALPGVRRDRGQAGRAATPISTGTRRSPAPAGLTAFAHERNGPDENGAAMQNGTVQRRPRTTSGASRYMTHLGGRFRCLRGSQRRTRSTAGSCLSFHSLAEQHVPPPRGVAGSEIRSADRAAGHEEYRPPARLLRQGGERERGPVKGVGRSVRFSPALNAGEFGLPKRRCATRHRPSEIGEQILHPSGRLQVVDVPQTGHHGLRARQLERLPRSRDSFAIAHLVDTG